mmetsp:Transcript_3200/g.4937  ORF Transcript_3200/g.4937 Transcript_3200/m.4937 type:complete len:181 (+) Transcript_3200:792-1334(+)
MIGFTLLETDGKNGVKEVLDQGVWLIVDNGYLNCSSTVPPMKTYIKTYDKVSCKWLESIQKDVKCTFEILKGRFCILKTGIPPHGIEATDKVFLTYCVLHHNFLLNEDGLDASWLGDDHGNHNIRDIGAMLRQRQDSMIDYDLVLALVMGLINAMYLIQEKIIPMKRIRTLWEEMMMEQL